MKTDVASPCDWCPPGTSVATVKIVWWHERRGCWCEDADGDVGVHVSYVCRDHVKKEVAALAESGASGWVDPTDPDS